MSSHSRGGDANRGALLEVEDLRTVFHTDKETVRAVDGVSFRIDHGETLGVVGESGSGKSVTARSIMGLVDSPGRIDEEASIRLDGRELTDLSEDEYGSVRGSEVAMVFQDPLSTLNPVYTVGNQLKETLRLHRGLGGQEATEVAVELLEDVGIPDAQRRLTEYPHQFSGGMQQRVIIALALACEPELLICDEPTTALDVTIQAQILELLQDLQEQRDLAIMFITHDMAVIAEMADRVAVMYAGEIVERAPVEALFEQPKHPYTNGLLDSIPGATASSDRLNTIDGEVPVPEEAPSQCRFEPRCEYAFEDCSAVHPDHVPVGEAEDHAAACLLYDERIPERPAERPPERRNPGRGTSADGERSAGMDGEPSPTPPTADVGDEDDPLISVRDLKTYYDEGGFTSSNPVKAVDGVSFDIREGETLGLVGESGCGKTTLGHTIIRLQAATDGRISHDGTDITELSGADLKRWRRNSQMVFQDPQSSLNERMTVGEIIREPLDVHDWATPAARTERVKDLLTTVGLSEEHYYRYPHQFSGGQRQRIGIARALALEPEFVVLDEPVSALDVSVQAQILNLLEDLQEELGLTYLFIAHDLSVVRHICDRVAVMYLGNVLELADTEELFRNPQNPYTHSLLSSIPEPDPTDAGERITLRGSPPNPRDPPSGCPFSTRCPAKIRPEEHAELDDEVWTNIQLLLQLLKERDNAERSLLDRAKELVGRSTRFSSVEEIYEELFGDLAVPAEVDARLEAVLQLVDEGSEAAARERLLAEFGSVCDTEVPDDHAVGDRDAGFSHCHRHRPEYEAPATLAEIDTPAGSGR